MDNFENELYICLKNKSGIFIPFYNIQGTFSNNLKGGGSIIDALSEIINFDQFKQKIKIHEENFKQNDNLNDKSSDVLLGGKNLENNVKSKENSNIEEYNGGKNDDSDNSIIYKYDHTTDNDDNNSILSSDFINYYKKKINN